MYLDHFGLHELPFSLTPDTSYFLANHHCQSALNTLLVALQTGEGFVKITGEVGTGKTLLCRHFLNNIDHINAQHEQDIIVSAYIPNPNLSPHELMLTLADELGIETNALESHQLHRKITQALLDCAARGEQVVVCFDEAQAMPMETLEAIRLLTNLETEKRKLLQIILFGQPELDQKLRHPSIRQLKQRIVFHYRLNRLNRNEVATYIHHRLRIAGYQGSPLFSHAGLHALHHTSQGIPRLINILAHKAMMQCYGHGGKTIQARHIYAAARDTEATHTTHYAWGIVALLLFTTALLSWKYWTQ